MVCRVEYCLGCVRCESGSKCHNYNDGHVTVFGCVASCFKSGVSIGLGSVVSCCERLFGWWNLSSAVAERAGCVKWSQT